MVAKEFFQKYRKISKDVKPHSYLCLKNANGKISYVQDVTSNSKKIFLHIDDTPNMYMKDIIHGLHQMNTRMDDTPERSKVICAMDESQNEYSLGRLWMIDDEHNVEVAIKKNKPVPPLEIAKKYQHEFTNKHKEEKFFTAEITKIAKRLGIVVVYIVFWLYYAIPVCSKDAKAFAIIAGALGYLFSPLDMISDLIPFIGFSDDATVLVAAYYAVLRMLTSENVDCISKSAKEAVRKIFGKVSDDDLKF